MAGRASDHERDRDLEPERGGPAGAERHDHRLRAVGDARERVEAERGHPARHAELVTLVRVLAGAAHRQTRTPRRAQDRGPATATGAVGGLGPGDLFGRVARCASPGKSDTEGGAASVAAGEPPGNIVLMALATATSARAEYGLGRRRRLLVLGICSLSLLIVGLDTTIVNVALPSIRASFHASLSELQWTIDAYTLVLGSLLMLAGSTADRVGRRRVFQTGLVVFSLASLLCALAPTTNTAVSGMPPSQAGVAAAIASTSRQVGMTLGVAVIGAVAGAGVAGEIGKGFAAATHAGWWIIAFLGAAVVVLGLLTTTRWADQTARETASRLREGRGRYEPEELPAS